MLGRLRMSLEECAQEYIRLGEKIFTPRRAKFSLMRVPDLLNAKGAFDSTAFEAAIKAIVEKRLRSAQADLIDEHDPNPQCKV